MANLTGDLATFWRILNKEGYILNWNGDMSPAVHQADHFMEEFGVFADSKKVPKDIPDRVWHGLTATSCLWGCSTSPKYLS
jgi:hypothetical protein